MGMTANERASVTALRFGDSAVQVNLQWEGPADLGVTQAAVLTALGVVGELMSAPRLTVGMAHFRFGAPWEEGPGEALAWPGPAAGLGSQLSRYLRGQGAEPAPGAQEGLALVSLGPVTARRVRLVLPAGVDLAGGLPVQDERGRPLPATVVPAAPVAGAASVWLQSPSTDLCSGFTLHVSAAGAARLALSLGALILDPSRDGQGDDLLLAGAPLARWRRAARAHLEAVQARLHGAGWAPRR